MSKRPTITRPYCGTTRGYASHTYHKEKPCDPCRKANTEHYRQLRKQQTVELVATCEQCGCEFKTTSNPQKPARRFCSADCRWKAVHSKMKYVRNCLQCSGEFETNNLHGTICSDDCRRRRRLLKTNRLTVRRGRLKKYGLTPAQYDELFSRQEGVCAICLQPETEKLHGKVKLLSIDHCHKTKIVRGLLCQKCNKALGSLQDNVVIAKRLVKYLIKNQTTPSQFFLNSKLIKQDPLT